MIMQRVDGMVMLFLMFGLLCAAAALLTNDCLHHNLVPLEPALL